MKYRSNYTFIDQLTRLLTDEHAMLGLADDWDEGINATTGGPGPKGSHAEPTETQAIRNLEGNTEGHGLANDVRNTYDAIQDIKQTIRDTWTQWRRLRPDDHHIAELKARSTDTRNIGVGMCQVRNCDTTCTGGLNDRLRTGMCPKHYRAWRRNLEATSPLTRDQFLATADGDMVTNETAGNPPTPTHEALPFGQSGVARPHDAA